MPETITTPWTARAGALTDAMPWADLALAALVALLAYTAFSFGLGVATRRMTRLAERTPNPVDDLLASVLRGTSRGVLALVALLIGVGLLDLGSPWQQRVGQLWFAVLAVQVALWGHRLIDGGVRQYEMKHASSGAPQVSTTATLLTWALRTVLWAIVLLAVLSNLGVNITAFVASLGVGGIAVALAVQNILGDLFASLSIAVNKPFEVGDSISVGGISGTVEQVGLKTTRIRALGGEQIVMSNTELLKQTVSNFKRLQTRRIAFTFGLTYDATPEQVERVPAMVKRLIEANPKAEFARAHFKAFGESSLDFEVVYRVRDPSYDAYMDVQQQINVALMRAVRAEGLDFAFPTRTLNVVHVDAPAPGRELPQHPGSAVPWKGEGRGGARVQPERLAT